MRPARPSPHLLLLALAASIAVRAPAHEVTFVPMLAQTTPVSSARAANLTPLTIELLLDDEPKPVAGLVRITSVATGQPIDLAAHLRRPMGWHSLMAGATVEVSPGEVRIEACHGLETEIATVVHSVGAGQPNRVKIPLRRFYRPSARNLVGANTHLHLRLNASAGMGGAALRSRRDAEEYLVAIGKSDALDLVFVSHLIRASEDQTYVSNGFTAADLARLSDARLRFGNGEEHRHEGGRSPRRGGPDELRYGHVLFLNLARLIDPVSYGAVFSPAAPSDAIPMRRAIGQAREQGATVIWCHGKQGTEDVPNWVAGLLHAQNVFDGGSEGTFETLFYPYLDAGLRVPFSTGTDWGCYDFSRAYVPLPGAVTSASFLEALAQGRSFITNGTFLELEVDGRAPGDTIELSRPGAVRVRARGVGRHDFHRLELVANGAVVGRAERRAVNGHFEAELSTTVDITEPGWLALRSPTERPYTDRAQYSGAGANLFGKSLFAHTSAVYVNVAGKSVGRESAIRTLLAELEASIRTITAKGAFANDAEREELLAIYRNAIGVLQGRMRIGR